MPTRATAASEAPLLHVRVQPRARRNEVVGWQGDALRVRVTAPPADGEANRAVTELVAKALGVSKAKVRILSGTTSRLKQIAVDGDPSKLGEALRQLTTAQPD